MNLNQITKTANQLQYKYTLGYLIKDDKILLALKRKGNGAGKWNGFGGKIENNETDEQGLIREAREELKITPLQFQKVATLTFYSLANPNVYDKAQVYFISEWDNVPTSSDELLPAWYNRDDMPYDLMWSTDRQWMPQVLEGEVIQGQFLFDEREKLLEHQIVVI